MTSFFASFRQKPLGALSFPLVVALSVGCGGDDAPNDPVGSGGNRPSTGGNAQGSGGTASGGSAPAAGGVSSGGSTSGGAASGGSPAAGGALPATGGSASGGAASGGSPAAGGSAPGSGGGNGSGGSSGSGFTCPTDLDGVVPSLEGKTAAQIMDVPEVQNGGFLEGPVWYEGKLYLSQIEFGPMPESGDIFTFTQEGGFVPFAEDVGTNGMAIDSQGRLIAASQQSAGVIAFDASDPSAAPVDIARMYDGNTFNSPNDVAVRSDGTVYFTDPTNNCGGNCGQGNVQGVYRVPPGGEPELLMTTQAPPNGIALSPDESTLYVGGSALTSHPVMPDGSVLEGETFGDITAGTDGLGIDCAGNVYVAQYTLSELIIFDPAGNRLPGSLSIQEITNVAFGGPNRDVLYITAFGDNRGRLYTVDMELPGLPY